MQFTNHTVYTLKEKFVESIILKNGSANYPAYSCDLTEIDFFLWGYIKWLVYANKLRYLQTDIERVIAHIRLDLTESFPSVASIEEIWIILCSINNDV